MNLVKSSFTAESCRDLSVFWMFPLQRSLIYIYTYAYIQLQHHIGDVALLNPWTSKNPVKKVLPPTVTLRYLSTDFLRPLSHHFTISPNCLSQSHGAGPYQNWPLDPSNAGSWTPASREITLGRGYKETRLQGASFRNMKTIACCSAIIFPFYQNFYD